jgi:hypothetical protein
MKQLFVPIKGKKNKIFNKNKLNKTIKPNYQITQCWMKTLKKKWKKDMG